jgi:hypothetical protein
LKSKPSRTNHVISTREGLPPVVHVSSRDGDQMVPNVLLKNNTFVSKENEMISNIPRRRSKEKFIVNGGYVTDQIIQYQVENSNGFLITNFLSTDKTHLECLLEEVLTRGIEQGKQEVRQALGIKE